MDCHKPRFGMLFCLLKRLISFLPDTEKDECFKSVTSKDQFITELLNQIWPPKQKEESDVSQQPRYLINILPGLRTSVDQSNKITVEELQKADYFHIFHRSTDLSDSRNLLKALHQAQQISFSYSYNKLHVSKFLEIFATCTTDEKHKEQIFENVSFLFKKLLHDSNPVVRQYSLEVFQYVATLTKYEQIICSVVSQLDPNINNALKDYVMKKPAKTNDPITFFTFLSKMNEEASCIASDISTEVEETSVPVKKIKLDEPDCTLQNILSLLQKVQAHFSRTSPNLLQLQQLDLIATELNKIKFTKS